MNRPACEGQNPELWFPESGTRPSLIAEAKAICADCPILQQCLTDALTRETGGYRYGIYGGLSPKERAAIAPRRIACRNCGVAFPRGPRSSVVYCSEDCRRAGRSAVQARYHRSKGAA